MTSTEAERDALNLTRDALSLVVVSPDYFRTGDQHSLMPNGDEESRTYYATASRLMGDEWAALIVGPDDPRGQIGWRIGEDYADLVGPNHGGWNIRRQYLTPVSNKSSNDEARPLAVGDRVKAPEESGRTFTQEEVDRLVREARAAVRLEAEQRFEQWKENASEIACQYADDNNLCGEFERCMDEIGLRGRSREYVVAVTFNVTVEARDEDDAEEQAAEIIRDDIRYRLSDATYDVEEA